MSADAVRHEFAVDGRTVVAYEAGAGLDAASVLLWSGGTPHTGVPLAPHAAWARAHHVRLISVARPGFGGSEPRAGRSVADAAADLLAVADALDVDRFALAGYSGGGPHALAAAALAGERALGAVAFASPAPCTGEESWFAGMHDPAALRSAQRGRAARETWGETADFDPGQFTADDWAALQNELAAVGEDAGRGGAAEQGGGIDDDVAFVSPWGVDLERITAPVHLVHGDEDRIIPMRHAHLLAAQCPQAEVHLRAGRGHVGVLRIWAEDVERMLR
ncbi:alpha/beta hydrolase [Microbacterium sp. 1P10UB]|uniref:alpha/beta fold hydrolase n=1 Tax=unclassified Microbacterium TaxID=2609290 RepID=UPI00399F7B85